MIKWLCLKLAECFRAHEEEYDRDFQKAVSRAELAAAEFNASLDDLSKYSKDGNDITIVYTIYGGQEYVSPQKLRIKGVTAQRVIRKGV